MQGAACGLTRLMIVYVPAHNAMPADEAARILRLVRLADLVTVDPETLAPSATPLPWVYRPELGEYGTLQGHVARTNTQWRHTTHPALVLVRGGDAYVNPDWYPSYRAGADGVPTWNYEVVQVTGTLVAHRDMDWVEQHVRELSATFDPDYDMDRSTRRAVEGMLRAVVGVELQITGVVGKSKLSQNRSSEDISGVIDAYTAEGRPDLAQRMLEVALPHALARETLVEQARRRRATQVRR